MKSLRILMILCMLLAGCVGLDTWNIRSKGDLPVEGLTSEQTHQLKSAAASGDPSLIATAGRMAWENPELAVSIANYAANLSPDRGEEIRASVVNGLAR